MTATCHIFLQAPPAPLTSIVAGDILVDLRLGASARPLDAAHASTSVRVAPVDLDARRFHDLARDAYVAWIARLGDRELGDRELGDPHTLKEMLLYGDGFSLWWLLQMHVKHYVKHPLPGLIQRVVWLEESVTDGGEVATLLGQAKHVCIHGNERRDCALIAAALAQVVPSLAREAITIARPDGTSFVDRARVARWAATLARGADGALRRVGQLGGFLGQSARHTLRTDGGHSALSKVDVALVTGLSDWVRVDDDGAPFEHRYLADTPRRLREAGLDVCWLPVVDRHEKVDELRELLSQADIPVAWDAVEAGLSASWRAVDGLREIQRRVGSARRHLAGHPALTFRDIDLSAWVLDEIDDEIGVKGLYHLQMYEMLRSALSAVRPDVILYRNEFYPMGRVVAAAARGLCRRWAYQHATIPRHHWVYLHDAREFEGRRDARERIPAPDRFLAYGPFVAELMTRHGYPAGRIQTIGSLRHDKMFELGRDRDDELGSRLARELGFPKDRPTFLICAQMPAWLPDWIGLLVDALDALDQSAHVVVKPHWKYRDIASIQRAFESRGWSDYAIYEGDLDSALLAADVSLTGSSTTGMESAILGTPLISFQREQPWETMPYVEDGLALPASDVESMKRALETLVHQDFEQDRQQRRRQFLERHLLNIERPANDALVTLLKELNSPSKNGAEP